METIPVAVVTALLTHLDEIYNMGGKLYAMACQCEPRLNTEPLPDEAAAVRAARDAAIERTSKG